ncbi:hypothetical protein N0V91_011264 [Didymella pomorum]|uniref:Uncharacterized protein n=1 Tax=Didymella pomorum TaxID=749634 RepID=A0A9W9CYP2_9PLEO|nr:hypothetical protein N0V91_011264 [Didymella pomorum]
MFGKDKDAYDNDPRHEKTEEKFMAEWRRLGPLGVFLDVINHIKRLEGRRSKQQRLNGRFSAIYKVIPTFKQLIAAFEDQLVMWEKVDFEQLEAPEDHMAINLRAAVAKLKLYYSKLSDSPAYYAAIVLHPRYRNYCKLAWAHDPARLAAADAAFRQLWRLYNHRAAAEAYSTRQRH